MPSAILSVQPALHLPTSLTPHSRLPFLQSKITGFRQQQGQQDCLFFLQGRCTKGSLCPYRHDPVGARLLPCAPQLPHMVAPFKPSCSS